MRIREQVPSAGLSGGGEWGNGVGLGFVVDAGEAEAEELEEFGAVAGHVGEVFEVFGADLGPEGGDGLLDMRAHFPVVDADAAGFVEGGGGGAVFAEALGEEAIDLFDAAFVEALGFHDFVEERDVEGDDGDGAAGLGDEGFVDGDDGVAATGGEFFLEALGGGFEVFLGAADGAVAVDGPGEVGADVAVGDGDGLIGEDAGGAEGIDPHFPNSSPPMTAM